MRLTTVLAVSLLFGCSNPTYSQGLGRPAYPPTERPTRLPVSIVEVYVTDPSPAARFALVVNEGTEDTPRLRLKGPAGEVSVTGEPGVEDIVVPAGMAAKVSLAPLTGGELLGGELAAVDDDGTVHAYIAWAADPTSSKLAGAAYASGATTPGAFVPTGLPPAAGLAFVSRDSAVGCATPAGSLDELAAPTPCPVTPGVLAIVEIVPAVAGAGDSAVTLRNSSAGPLDLLGVRLCQGGGCTVITSELVIAAGADQVLHVGASPGKGAVFAGVPITGESELAVLAPGSGLTATAPTLQAYVRFGAGAARFADAAAAAGLWPSATAVAEGVRVPGELLRPIADPALPPPAWAPVASLGTPDIGPASNLWTTCSAPRRWGPQATSKLVVSRLEGADTDTLRRVRLTLTNRDDAQEVSLSGVELDLVTTDAGDAAKNVTTTLDLSGFGTLAPGASQTFELAEDAASCSTQYATACRTAPALTARGELALRQGTTMVQYLAWDSQPNQVGAPVPPRALIADALAANLWPGFRGAGALESFSRDCGVVLPGAGSAINLDPTRDGRSPPDWQ